MSVYLIMAGGTGGHIFPALAVAKKLENKEHRIVWLGSEGAMETRMIPQHHIQLETIKIKGIRGNGWVRKLKLPWTLLQSIIQVRKIIKLNKIKGVIGFGGFVSFPGGIAARLSNIPLFIHEQNAIAGLSNKVLARIATQVYYAFPKVFKNTEGYVGNPIRREISEIADPSIRFQDRTGSLKVLIVGGSLGAQFFNETLPKVMKEVSVDKRPIIKHQTGKGRLEAVQQLYSSLGVAAECVEFIENIEQDYQEVDFVICRSGALTVSELSAVGLGAYFIPFPFAVDDHQTFNAQVLVKHGAAQCIRQSEFSLSELKDSIEKLSRADCLNWAKKARSIAKIDADEIIANALINISKE